MKSKTFLLAAIFALAAILTGCSDSTATDSVQTEDAQQTEAAQTTDSDSEEETSASESENSSSVSYSGYEILKYYSDIMDDMADFLEEGIEKADKADLSMKYMTISLANSLLLGAYNDYVIYGENWDSGKITDDTYGLITQTSLSNENDIVTYKNSAFDTEDDSQEIVTTVIEYDANKNYVLMNSDTATPETTSVSQYYVDESGAFYYLSCEVAMGSLYVSIVYYDGSFIGISKAEVDGAIELILPYDFSVQKPTSYEDMLTYESYNSSFTYDGDTAQYIGN